jgi:hypothetical protein
MSYLTGHLPVVQGVACWAALAREADSLRASGDSRSRGQIMADTLVERVTGRATATGTPVEVDLITSDKTLFTGAAEPAHLVGYGTIPAEIARGLVRDADRAWIRRLYADPDRGALVSMDSRRRRFTGQRRHQLILINDICATPYCDAPVRHADHPLPVREAGETSGTNGAGLCEACNYTKDLPGWHAVLHTRSDGTRILDLISPTGHRQRGRPPDPPGAPDPSSRLLRTLAVA